MTDSSGVGALERSQPGGCRGAGGGHYRCTAVKMRMRAWMEMAAAEHRGQEGRVRRAGREGEVRRGVLEGVGLRILFSRSGSKPLAFWSQCHPLLMA